tara:strand:- start:27469 stop:30384 length:2916 start_codon:yes stop_codon:yes gene_type:complete
MVSKTTFKKQILFVIALISIALSNAQSNLPYSTNFESNNGGWTDGGGDSKYGSYTSSPQGNKSWEIKDNSGNASSFYQDFNLSGYITVTISFSFESNGFDNGWDAFTVQLDNNAILSYTYSNDWSSNGTKYTATIVLNSSDYTFKSDSEIKFETTGWTGDSDKLYIDEISITGTEPIPCTTDAITLPWNEDFETSTINEYTSNTNDLGGLCGWDYNKTNEGRLRFNTEKHTGAKAALLDDSGLNFTSSENYMIKTLNLSNYTSTTDLELSFWFADYGDENDTNDAVWIRGNNTAIWVKAYTINPESKTDDTWNHVENLDIDALLQAAGQTVSETFQIKLGQYGYTPVSSWGATWSDGIAYDDIKITGSQDAIWRDNAWVNNMPPSIGMKTIIDDDYNTGIEGSFSSKALTVNADKILTVDNNTFVEVENDVVVNGRIIIQTQGAFVQNNDNGNITGTGLMTVNKETAAANNWFEYTYWSAPVSGETIGNGLFESGADRRFKFVAQNYLDAKKEVGNNNAKLDGQDDVDDNGDDWAWANAATPMLPGVGYASTHNKTIFNSTPGSPKKIIYVFDGKFNNGIYNIPIYRNDSELNDTNWNFIGNPYPSAIDADLFLTANSDIATDIASTKSLNGAIFLWSQNTPPSGTANGNQQLNFSNDDYAIINFSGELAGGDGIKPTRHIPSGQGFFVAMDNNAAASLVSGDVYTSNVIFNNGMRVKGATDNNQFFKSSNTKEKSINTAADKLWINLTSDNGVFNQILVGYINGATNNDDGAAYDATKYPTKGAALYTTITGSNQKYAIQGKDVNSVNPDEIINLGFSTTINVATLYKLSLEDLQGDFLTNNTVYLKDNLLNKIHNLSASNYTFTSVVGEFNNRFEIVFNANTLSHDSKTLNETIVNIVELQNNDVQFNVSNHLKIQSVAIFDVLGKQVYQFKGQNSLETYNLSNLSSTVYVAKVTLNNGSVITKKAFKK